MIQVHIFDNHKIPRKYREGYTFWVLTYSGFKPRFTDEWICKNKYLTIYPYPIDMRDKVINNNQGYFFTLMSTTVKVRRGRTKRPRKN